MKDLTFAEAKERLYKIIPYLEGRYLGNDSYTNMMINAPMFAAFCDDNKDSISESTIVMMAIKIIADDHGIPYWMKIDEWIDHFKQPVLKHLLEK